MHIFVEGSSDKIFLEMLCSYLNINAEYTATSGKDNLINTVKIKKYDNPVIIFDADDDFQNSISNIKNQIEILDSTISPKIFLFPDNENTGNLETLLEDICIHTDIKDCFIKYKTCIQTIAASNNKILSLNPKSQIFAYLEVFGYKTKFKNLQDMDYRSIFNFEHEKLKPLIDFLKENA